MSEQNFNNPNQGMNRPRLKKVKRPIRRIMPQDPAQPKMPQQTRPSQQVEYRNDDEIATPIQSDINPFSVSAQNDYDLSNDEAFEDVFNADVFEDSYVEEENLPSTLNQRQKYNQQPQFLDSNAQNQSDDQSNGSFYFNGMVLSRNVLIMIGLILFFMGFLVAKLLFSEEKVVREGLQGVVVNTEVPRGRARCGTTEKTQGCVLYIMNPQRQELFARDFYDLASQLTGRQRFVIETGNMRYSNIRIRPGELAQFNIPPLQ